MKKSLLFATLAAPMLSFAAAPGLVNEPAPLPAEVTQVSPAQGFVDLSGDVCPLGVGEISFVFAGSADVVPQTNVHSELYKDGVFLAESKDAYIDIMGARLASINFGGARKAAGWYEVKVAEGQFTIGGAPSPAMTLFYQIENFCSIEPVAGVVEQVDNVFFYFDENVVKVEVDETKYDNLTCLAHCTINGSAVTPEYQLTATALNEGDEWAGAISFGSEDGIAQIFFYEGNYEINVPAGLFISYSKGENYAEDPTDLIERRNPRYNIHYVIPSFPQPEITPEYGSVVENFYEFVITPDAGFVELLFSDNMSSSHIYPVFDGQVDTSNAICNVKSTGWDLEANTVTYKVIDPATKRFAEEPLVVEPGDYAFVLADKSFSCIRRNDQAQVWAAPYQYFYTVKGGESKVESVAVAEGDKAVYNLQGIKINKEVNALPAGLYIINGKKILVK